MINKKEENHKNKGYVLTTQVYNVMSRTVLMTWGPRGKIEEKKKKGYNCSYFSAR